MYHSLAPIQVYLFKADEEPQVPLDYRFNEFSLWLTNGGGEIIDVKYQETSILAVCVFPGGDVADYRWEDKEAIKEHLSEVKEDPNEREKKVDFEGLNKSVLDAVKQVLKLTGLDK